jgi:hypothetical protein
MLSFEVKQQSASSCTPGSNSHVLGRVAPGNGVLIIQDGSAWVAGQDGSRVMANATSVICYRAGDWVEYGTTDWFKVEEYWDASEPEEAAVARLAAEFGPQGS